MRTTLLRGCLCGAQHPIAPEDIPPSCQPYMGDPDSSYGSGATNIKKLADLYYEAPIADGEGPIKQVCRPLYIEGIGTQSNEKDSIVGQSTGRGETGVAGRVQTSFTFIKQVVEDALQRKSEQ